MKYLIYIIAGMIGGLIAHFLFSIPTPPVTGHSALESKIDSLTTEIVAKQKQVEIDKIKIDSLKKLPPKIVIRYEKIYVKIDSMPVDSIIAEFGRIFTKEGDNLNWRHGRVLYR